MQFNRLPVAAVQNMVGLTGQGTPVGDVLARRGDGGADGLRQALVDGIALGRNPVETGGVRCGRGWRRALRMATIARTETLRVHRRRRWRLSAEPGDSGVSTAGGEG